MQSQLRLSDNQAAGVMELLIKQRNSVDSLGGDKLLKLDERRTELEKMMTKYEKSFKDLLSNSQWKVYLAMKAEQRAALIKRMEEKKIPIKELIYDPG